MSIFDKAEALDELMNDRLPPVLQMTRGKMPSSESLWASLQTAEAKVSRKLGMSLEPVEIFSVEQPTPEQLAELDGRPYEVEPGYDMEAGMLGTFQWGTIMLSRRPLIEVVSVHFVYPTINTPIYEVPKDWIFPDFKGGIIQFSPKPMAAGLAPSLIGANIMARGGGVPQMVRVRYRAGLSKDHPLMEARTAWAEVRDLAMRLAVLGQMKFTPQSSSMSADGLSQSKSIDVDKFRDAIDHDLEDLRERLMGPVWGVL